MRFFISIASLVLFCFSCTLNQNQITEIRVLDRFLTEKENIQLGIDLVNLEFLNILFEKHPAFTPEILNNVSWFYFVKDSNNEVSFRIKLQNEALTEREKLITFFENVVDEQIMIQDYKRPKFKEAIELAENLVQQLDINNYEFFWNLTSEIFKETTSRNELIEFSTIRDDLKKKGGVRNLSSKQHYKKMPGTELEDIYVVTFGFEKDKNMLEQISFINIEDTLSVVGYDYLILNE